MALNGPELELILRKSDFPYCAREAMTRLEQLCVPHAQKQAPTAKQLDFMLEIIDEFIFCEVDRRGIRKKHLNSLQELQLLEVLSDYFMFPNNEVIRNTVFMTLFTPSHLGPEYKMRVLSKLVSMAVATKNIAVLNCSGAWMQQQGCTSTYSLQLAQVLVDDYFNLVPRAVSWLHDLPQLAPQFTANFITAVAELYAGIGRNEKFSPPPCTLLDVLTQWATSHPHLCLAALTTNLQPVLPKGSIIMPSVTPIAGLLKWCVEAPVYSAVKTLNYPNPEETKKAKEEKALHQSHIKLNGEDLKIEYSEHELYSKLHLALLDSMLETQHIQQQMVQREVVSLRHLVAVVESLLDVVKKNDLQAAAEFENVQLSLDRLGQAIQVAISTGCVYGNMQDFFQLLKKLPSNRLLHIVIKNNS